MITTVHSGPIILLLNVKSENIKYSGNELNIMFSKVFSSTNLQDKLLNNPSIRLSIGQIMWRPLQLRRTSWRSSGPSRTCSAARMSACGTRCSPPSPSTMPQVILISPPRLTEGHLQRTTVSRRLPVVPVLRGESSSAGAAPAARTAACSAPPATRWASPWGCSRGSAASSTST